MNQNGFRELVLEVVRSQQVQLDRLAKEIDGGNLAGLKQVSIENAERITNLTKVVEKTSDIVGTHEDRLNENEVAHRVLAERVGGVESRVTHDETKDDRRLGWIAEVIIGVILLAIGVAFGKAF